jgi:S-adenosylmethionine hydrolase
MMSIITLTTDFGLRDHFVGALKGKILSEFPEASIIDISHEVDLFNVYEASYLLKAAYSSFPEGTVHIVGVDAELHPDNKPVAIKWHGQYFICADNGILSILTQKIKPEKIVVVNIREQLPENAVDMDVFVKVACHLAKGGLLQVVGKEIDKLKEIIEPKPAIAADKTTIKGNVIYVDHFGNAVLNITKTMFEEISGGRNFSMKIGKNEITNIYKRYADITANARYSPKYFEGKMLAVFNEAGYLEIAIYRSNPNSVGSASSLLGLRFQSEIRITFK